MQSICFRHTQRVCTIYFIIVFILYLSATEMTCLTKICHHGHVLTVQLIGHRLNLIELTSLLVSLLARLLLFCKGGAVTAQTFIYNHN